MARPNVERTNLGFVDSVSEFANLRDRRIEDLRRFATIVGARDTIEKARADDAFFIALLNMAIEAYGLQKAIIALEINMSAAAVGRWAKGDNLPTGGTRRDALEAIQKLLSSSIETAERKKIHSKDGRTQRRPKRVKA